jgi:O-antigen/teichoic acid export membrane protein
VTDRGAPSARLRTLASQSAIYGIGPVIARFAGLLLLPIYARQLGTEEVANVGQVVALVAVGATVAQLGLVNALFRFAAEREGDARFAVARTAIALCAAAGLVVALVAAASTPFAAPLFLGNGNEGLWLVACAGLLVSLLYEPTTGLYRVEQRPQRFLAVTLVNVAVTVVVSVVWIIHFHGGALGLMAGSYTGTLVALLVVLWDRRRCCASGCRSCPRGWRSGRSTSPTGCSCCGSRRARSRASSWWPRTWPRRSRCS